MKNNLIVAAAMLGMIGATTVTVTAHAADAKGKCMGANSCKTHNDCKGEKNSCKGTSGCKGQGWKSMTEKACDKMAKKNPKVKWEANEATPAAAGKTDKSG